MPRRIKKITKRNVQFTDKSNSTIRKIVVVVVIGIVGLIALTAIIAATFAIAGEAENGAINGNAAVVSDATASGSGAVTFGGYTPTNLQVFTGGNNIALVWDMPVTTLKSVQIYRDNQQIATVSPNANAPFQNGQLGKEYDDKNVAAGTTYTYKVRGITNSGTISAFTPTISVTQPANTTPQPNITIDSSQAPTLATYMTNNVVPLLKTWYPKVADEIAYPSYTPLNNFTITLSTAASDCHTNADANGGLITCSVSFIQSCSAAGKSCAAIFVHESTHVIQAGQTGGKPWSTEGGASWASDFFARQNINTYHPYSEDLIDKYNPGAWFLQYIRKNYDENFPRDINIAAHNNVSLDTIVSQDTGGKFSTVDDAWQAAINSYSSSTGDITGVGGKCFEAQNGTVTSGTKLVLNSCNAVSNSATLGVTFNSGIAGKCLDDWNGSSSSNADLYSCNGTSAQMWMLNSDNTVRGYSGGCLVNNTGTSTDGNRINLTTCSSTDAAQKWNTSNNIIKNPATSKCIADPNDSTVSSTALVLFTCNGANGQIWDKSGGMTITGDFAQQWNLTYQNASKTGDFEIYTPYLSAYTGNHWCADVTNGGTTNGTGLQYSLCTNTGAQLWMHGANGSIVNLKSGKCLDTKGGSSTNGTILVINACSGSTSQQWATP